MRLFVRSAVALFVAAALGGCAGTQLEKVHMAQPPSGDFARGLYSGYVDLSELEYGEGDYWDSDVFANGALNAAAGQIQDPEEIASRALPEDKVGELSKARGRLMSALDATARNKFPALASRAQVMFDCWMQEQEENWQPQDIARCRDRFDQSMSELEAAMAPPVVEQAPTPPPPEPAVVEEIQRSYIVFFDWDSASVTNEAMEVIARAAKTAAEHGVGKIATTGHTDLSGPASYNLSLSDSRAMAVKDALVGVGMSANGISTVGLGETEPLVETPDGVREPQNRRVELLLKE